MVFKKILQRFGVGGPSVDTVLTRPDTQPGRTLTGQVNITGGDHDVDIDHVALALVVRAEHESGDYEGNTVIPFAHLVVANGFRLASGENRSIPFEMPVPWETPITHLYGSPLRGMAVGVQTELAVAKSVDKGDLDMVNVHPLASQEAVLEAFQQLGFGFKHADVETGHIAGLRQELPFYQEIEYFPPQHFAHQMGEVELTFVADTHNLAVVLEADRRGGAFGGGGDSFGRFHVSHPDAENHDWAGGINAWLSQLAEHSAHYGHHEPHGHYEHEGHGGGVGVGGVVAGVAAGVVGGMVLGEVFDEVGDFFEGDED